MAKKKNSPRTTKKQKSAWDFYPSVVREVALAYGRVNGVPARRLRWLLDFSELDLDSLSEGHLANLRWELVAFGLNRKPAASEGRNPDLNVIWGLHAILQKTLVEMIAEPQKGVPLALLREFQTTMRKTFDDLFKPTAWQVTRPTVTEKIALRRDPRTDEPILMNEPAEFTGHDILLTQAIDLIKAEKDRLRICHNPRCNKRFVAAKKGRAFFHSPQCSAIVRVHRMRGKM